MILFPQVTWLLGQLDGKDTIGHVSNYANDNIMRHSLQLDYYIDM